jgi:hypothetical protein
MAPAAAATSAMGKTHRDAMRPRNRSDTAVNPTRTTIHARVEPKPFCTEYHNSRTIGAALGGVCGGHSFLVVVSTPGVPRTTMR